MKNIFSGPTPPAPLPFSKEGGELHCFNTINGYHLSMITPILGDHLNALITLQAAKLLPPPLKKGGGPGGWVRKETMKKISIYSPRLINCFILLAIDSKIR